MTDFNENNNIVDDKEATVVAGAIGCYLGHNKFKILSIKEYIEEDSLPEEKMINRGLFSFMSSWRTND